MAAGHDCEVGGADEVGVCLGELVEVLDAVLFEGFVGVGDAAHVAVGERGIGDIDDGFFGDKGGLCCGVGLGLGPAEAFQFAGVEAVE